MTARAKTLLRAGATRIGKSSLADSTDVSRASWFRNLPAAARIALGLTLGGFAAALTSDIGFPDTGSTYILLYPVVFLCAYAAGRDSGLSAAGAGALLFFIQLMRSWSSNPFRLQHLASLLLFTAIGTGTAVLLTHLKRSRNQSEAATRAAVMSRNEAQKAHEEADLLLRELSHRVKNDVTNLVAILRLQAQRADQQASIELLTAADRLVVLSRVHQRLSRHGHSVVVDLGEFLRELCSDLDATLLGVRAISLRCNIASLQVASGEAVAIGLIVNELLTNAVKYAFPEGRSGKIDVSVDWAGPQTLEIAVRDDGKGFDARENTAGLGQKLIGSLTAQLDGTYECSSGAEGTECVVRFPSPAQTATYRKDLS